MTGELIDLARAGDTDAFGQLVDPYRRELQVHCYRILGSAQDAEDALQETLVAAWQGLAGFEGRASIRTWMYKVATSRCLNALRAGRRRPSASMSPRLDPPDPTRRGEVLWLEPYPDDLLDGLPDPAPGPEARYDAREAISLAFVTAVALLPPRQRAVLILRDVLGFPAREVADILDSSVESVTSALKRGRATLRAGQTEPGTSTPPPPPDSLLERELVARLTRAYEAGAVDDVVALLTEDAWLSMPPAPLQYQGRAAIGRFLTAVAFAGGRTCRLVATHANRQPAFGVYLPDPHGLIVHANGLLVLTLAGDRISAMTRFDNSVLPRFGLPRTLPT
ncbi:MAG TPA: sigma-70 family RNA polymerase sigma factor [Pseudonocardia sp.]